jgi:hypothetical protein
MSVYDIATVTRIPVRSLERLESGLFEELPADVFVRGFLRSYARCVGLDADEIIRRYSQCGMPPAPVCSPAVGENAEAIEPQGGRQRGSELRAVTAVPVPSAAPATVATEDGGEARRVPWPRSVSKHGAEDEPVANETRAEQAARKGSEPVSELDGEPVAPVEQRVETATEQPRRKRKRRRRKQRRDLVETSVAQPAQHEHAQGEEELAIGPEPADIAVPTAQATDQGADAVSASSFAPSFASSGARAGTSADRATRASAVPVVSDGVPQPVTERVHARSGSVRLQTSHSSGRVRASTVTARPVLIIDDEHPEDAERSQEERVERSDASWRSFLPPSLLDSDDGSHRGTLTLAVIILVIVATLTMSYLLRRPNVSGDGVTWNGPDAGQTEKTSSSSRALA